MPGSSARLSVSASGTANNPPTGCGRELALEHLQIRDREAGARGVVHHDPVVVARASDQRHAAHCGPSARAALRRCAVSMTRVRRAAIAGQVVSSGRNRYDDPGAIRVSLEGRQRVLDDRRTTECRVLLGTRQRRIAGHCPRPG